MKKEMIQFTLYEKMPPTLFAEYKGKKVNIGLSVVPKVMEAYMNDRILLFEEELALAHKYLMNLLTPN